MKDSGFASIFMPSSHFGEPFFTAAGSLKKNRRKKVRFGPILKSSLRKQSGADVENFFNPFRRAPSEHSDMPIRYIKNCRYDISEIIEKCVLRNQSVSPSSIIVFASVK